MLATELIRVVKGLIIGKAETRYNVISSETDQHFQLKSLEAFLLNQNSHDRHRNTIFVNFNQKDKGYLKDIITKISNSENCKIYNVETKLKDTDSSGCWTDEFIENFKKQIKNLVSSDATKPSFLIINGFEKSFSYINSTKTAFNLINFFKSKELKNLRSVNFFVIRDQLSTQIYKYLVSICNSEVSIGSDESNELMMNQFEVNYYFKEISGFSESYIYEITIDHVKETVSLEEAKRNREVIQEMDPDKLVKGTFSMGLSESQKQQKDNVLLPHIELIKHYEESDEEEDQILGVDDEQDEDEDVDV